MINAILWRVKKLLDITDSADDEKIILLIENAMLQFRAYMNDDNLSGLEPLLASYVGFLLTSGEGAGTSGTISSSSSSSSTSGGGVEPILGELKAVSYSGVREEYTNSSDFVNKSSSSQSEKTGTTSSGDAITWFTSHVVPVLRSRRKVGTLTIRPVATSPERY